MQAVKCHALLAIAATAAAAGSVTRAEPVEIVLHRINSAHRQNYDALERAPIRPWGELEQLRPLNDLLHVLRNPSAAAEARSLKMEAAAIISTATRRIFRSRRRVFPPTCDRA
jgi:hypothetical protein